MTKQNWHLDKKIPLAFLGAFIVYGIGAIVYASKLDSSVSSCQTEIINIKKILDDRGRIGETYFTRLDRLEVRFDGFEKAQGEIASNIKVIMERQYNENFKRGK